MKNVRVYDDAHIISGRRRRVKLGAPFPTRSGRIAMHQTSRCASVVVRRDLLASVLVIGTQASANLAGGILRWCPMASRGRRQQHLGTEFRRSQVSCHLRDGARLAKAG